MRTVFHIIAASTAFFLLTSCGPAPNRYLPVFHNKPRISTLGFSISPPPGMNWYEKVSDGSILYLKKSEPKNYFIYIKATELHFKKEFACAEDFLAYVKAKKDINIDPDLYKNGSSEYLQTQQKEICVKYQQHYEDHSIKTSKSPDSKFFANVNSHGLICIHPEKPGIGIDMFYLEREIPGTSVVSYADEGEQFLASLAFLDKNTLY